MAASWRRRKLNGASKGETGFKYTDPIGGR